MKESWSSSFPLSQTSGPGGQNGENAHAGSLQSIRPLQLSSTPLSQISVVVHASTPVSRPLSSPLSLPPSRPPSLPPSRPPSRPPPSAHAGNIEHCWSKQSTKLLQF